MTPREPTHKASAEPDVEIGATVRARRLRFSRRPEAEIAFPGSDPQRSGSHTERRNLPQEVEPGVTYRNVQVRWRAAAGVDAQLLGALSEQPDAAEEDRR